MIVSKVVLLFPFFFLVKEKKNTKKVRRLIPRDTLTFFLGCDILQLLLFIHSFILRTNRQLVKTIVFFVFFWGGGDFHTFRSLFHQRSYLSIHLIHLSLEIEQHIYISTVSNSPNDPFFRKEQKKQKQNKIKSVTQLVSHTLEQQPTHSPHTHCSLLRLPLIASHRSM